MILDARDHLYDARDGFTDPVEVEALDEFLGVNGPVSAALSFVADKVVWMFTGDVTQLAIPIGLTHALTRRAREDGTLQKFFDEFKAEVEATLEAVRLTLFPE